MNGDDLYGATEGMPLERVLSLVADVTKALQFLHTRGRHSRESESVQRGASVKVRSKREDCRLWSFTLFQWTEQDEMLRIFLKSSGEEK